MPILEVNGQPLNYEILRGEGLSPEQPRQTLVLVHGIIIDNLASYYMTIAPAIAAAGIDVIMFDHRGARQECQDPQRVPPPARGRGHQDAPGRRA
ncbi:hypothetical protein ODZ83_04815 [Acaricomes phytoseiuli]|uniref:hypothetical protein n=1 Tax=Acaricomes phytoseiuli TaxID=291968 RepID=UPI0022220EFE|nr:hypothetical protein [Acaricomes phytoseiuli]MCW1249512.1 hypothetical protein [Acaricomes phytoseiuli]